jgi:hypothetical protein
VRETAWPFLTGAGCLLTAGIPLAAQLVKEIKDKYPDDIKRLVNPELQDDYGCCIGALALGERKELLDPHLRSAKINWAHCVSGIAPRGHSQTGRWTIPSSRHVESQP